MARSLPYRRLRARSNANAETTHAYQQRAQLLSRGEAAFYRALRRAVGARLGISLKTRLADVLHVRSELEWSADHLAVTSKHIDFVLYDLETTAVVAAIELDDRSHRRRSRTERDEFTDAALRAANVTVIHVTAAARYPVRAVCAVLHKYVGPAMEASRARSPRVTRYRPRGTAR